MNISLLPTAVDVTLYRYNHLDNQMWVRIKNDIDYIPVDDNSVMVSYEQLSIFLETYYLPEINKIKSVGSEFLHKKVHSPYFIYMMMMDMQNLQYIKFTKSYDKSFSRILEVDGNKILKFDFKVLSVTIPLHEIFNQAELNQINPILERLKILEEDVPYARIKMIDLLDQLDAWISVEMDNDIPEDSVDPIPLITMFMDMVDAKVESDNPLVLLVTDY